MNRPRAAAIPDRIADTKRCPYCSAWIESPHGRRELDRHKRECDRRPSYVELTAPVPAPPTVKMATLFDGVVETYQTETELNGWKPSQGKML